MGQELSTEEVNSRMESLEIWGLEGDRLVTEVEFDTYRDAVFFANAVFSAAEEQYHHPEVKVEYSSVSIDVYAHNVAGLTEEDFELARTVEKRLQEIDWD